MRQAYSLFQLTGHTIGVALAPGDIIDQLLPLILGSFGFEGAGNSVQYERLYFAAYLALRPVRQQRRSGFNPATKFWLWTVSR